MRRWVAAFFFLASWAAHAQMMPDIFNAAAPAGVAGYQGPGDVISGATGWYGLRAYSSGQIGGTTKAINLRRASDNTTCDFDINTSGNLGGTDSGCSLGGGLSLASFATQDATATCTIATTTATCSGASSTPNVGSTITGAGVTQPCVASAVGTFTAGAGTVTLIGNGAASPCGTIGSGTTLTFTYGLFAATVYDQTGNGNNVVQATTGSQPQLLPNCINALPCLAGQSGINRELTATIASTANASWAAVARRNYNFTTASVILAKSSANIQFSTSANTLAMGANTLAGVADQSSHAIQGAYGATSRVCADGTCNTGTVTAPAAGTGLAIMSNTTSTLGLQGFFGEGGFWATVTFTTGQIASMCHNQFLYWNTAVSC